MSYEGIQNELESIQDTPNVSLEEQNEKLLNSDIPENIIDSSAEATKEDNRIEDDLAAEILKKEIEKNIDWELLQDHSFNDSSFYRVTNENGYKDYLENEIVRSSPTGTDSHITSSGIDIGHRPTGFPSFDKSRPNPTYLKIGENNYIIESGIPMYKRGDINPVSGLPIKGRHWAYRPIDSETGKDVNELPKELVKDVYKVDKENNLHRQTNKINL